MLRNYLQGDFDLISFLVSFLTSLPAFIIALVFHEAAHGYVALKRGDPTAKLMGRVTLNPLRHLDLMGFLFMLVAGVGWAKPVPVNPRNFRHPRRDDLLVSLAGIAMNLILCIISSLVMYGFITLAIGQLPGQAWLSDSTFVATTAQGLYRIQVREAYLYAWAGMDVYLIVPVLGSFVGYIYTFFVRLAIVNLSLALFNLLPVPPLDGYHVVNDLILRGNNLFASRRVGQIGSLAIIALMLLGVLDKALTFVLRGAFSGMGTLFYGLVRLTGHFA